MMTCSSVFFVSFPKYPKIDGNDEKLFFWNLASFYPLKLTAKAVKMFRIKRKKDHKLVCVGKYLICISVLRFYRLFIRYKTS